MTGKQTLGSNDQNVLTILSQNHAPMTAYDILDALKGSRIRAASQVYRALEKLLTRNLIHRVESLNSFVVCDHTHHTSLPGFFVCKTCKSVTEFDPVEEVSLLTSKASGFKIERYSVELTGTCVTCQTAEGAAA
jgi:Fur family transcriptional regulator, zinc uptake regulator